MFVGVGELKAALASYKSTKSFLLIKDVISKGAKKAKKLISSLKKQNTPVPADAPPVPKPKQLPAPQPESTTIKKLPSGAELIKENNSISLNTGYIQNKKAVKHNFITYGNRLSGKGYKRFKYKLTEMKVEEKYIKEMYRSSNNRPNIRTVKEGMELYKIVPKNSIVHDRTPYWLTKEELINILNSNKGIENMLALPEESCIGVYEIYKITLKDNVNLKKVRIFESRIAPSKQGTVKRKGGAKQILVPNRRQWTAAVKIEEFKIE